MLDLSRIQNIRHMLKYWKNNAELVPKNIIYSEKLSVCEAAIQGEADVDGIGVRFGG